MHWLRSLFAWREVRNTGVHSYQRNTVTGRRRVLRCAADGYQPVDGRWLALGEWDDAPHDGPRPLVPQPVFGFHAERRVMGVPHGMVSVLIVLVATGVLLWFAVP